MENKAIRKFIDLHDGSIRLAAQAISADCWGLTKLLRLYYVPSIATAKNIQRATKDKVKVSELRSIEVRLAVRNKKTLDAKRCS